LAGQIDTVAGPVNLLLAAEWKVVAILGDEDVRQQAGRGQAALLQAFG
jgi:hypothetical protein